MSWSPRRDSRHRAPPHQPLPPGARTRSDAAWAHRRVRVAGRRCDRGGRGRQPPGPVQPGRSCVPIRDRRPDGHGCAPASTRGLGIGVLGERSGDGDRAGPRWRRARRLIWSQRARIQCAKPLRSAPPIGSSGGTGLGSRHDLAHSPPGALNVTTQPVAEPTHPEESDGPGPALVFDRSLDGVPRWNARARQRVVQRRSWRVRDGRRAVRMWEVDAAPNRLGSRAARRRRVCRRPRLDRLRLPGRHALPLADRPQERRAHRRTARSRARAAMASRVDESLELVNLDEHQDNYPTPAVRWHADAGLARTLAGAPARCLPVRRTVRRTRRDQS